MQLYRITKLTYLSDVTGEGSRLFGGRWNSVGVPALYTSSHRSLAMLETLVYTPFKMLKDFGMATFELPDEAPILSLAASNLPFDWDVFPSRRSTAIMGNSLLLEREYLAFKVPSALLPEEWNVVINPLHPLMNEVRMVAKRALVFNERFKNVLE